MKAQKCAKYPHNLCLWWPRVMCIRLDWEERHSRYLCKPYIYRGVADNVNRIMYKTKRKVSRNAVRFEADLKRTKTRDGSQTNTLKPTWNAEYVKRLWIKLITSWMENINPNPLCTPQKTDGYLTAKTNSDTPKFINSIDKWPLSSMWTSYCLTKFEDCFVKYWFKEYVSKLSSFLSESIQYKVDFGFPDIA